MAMSMRLTVLCSPVGEPTRTRRPGSICTKTCGSTCTRIPLTSSEQPCRWTIVATKNRSSKPRSVLTDCCKCFWVAWGWNALTSDTPGPPSLRFVQPRGCDFPHATICNYTRALFRSTSVAVLSIVTTSGTAWNKGAWPQSSSLGERCLLWPNSDDRLRTIEKPDAANAGLGFVVWGYRPCE